MNEEPTHEKQPTILLVEADEHLGWVIAAYLERDGCRVVRVASLQEVTGAAKGELARYPVDLLILDLDYLEVGQTALGIDAPAAVPVLLLASGPLPPPSARRPSAPPLLRKPFGMCALRRHVRAALCGPAAVTASPEAATGPEPLS